MCRSLFQMTDLRRRRNRVGTALLVAAIICLAFADQAAAQTKPPPDPPQERKYSQGSLTTADFLAEAPDPASRGRRLLALTTTELKYDFRYHFSKRGEKCTGRVESIEVFAVVLQTQSWNQRPQDKVLLDHEQGHFDLTQIQALQAQAELTRRLKEESLVAVGKTESQVQQALNGEVRKLLRPFGDAAKLHNDEYDRVTAHGTLPTEQAQARKEQKELLIRLSAKLKEE